MNIKLRLTIHFRKVLRYFYNFDEWHISPAQSRPYVKFIQTELNALQNRTRAIEIGCGLGEILAGLDFDHRIGVDQDEQVIKAAILLAKFRFHKNSNLNFQHIALENLELIDKFDVIIMVNWTHNIKTEDLIKSISKLKNNLSRKGMIILDIMSNTKYAYNHDLQLILAKTNMEMKMSEKFEHGRSIHFLSDQ